MATQRRARPNMRQTPEGTERRCSRCTEWWPADAEFFYSHRDGLHSWCRACTDEARNARDVRPAAAPAAA